MSRKTIKPLSWRWTFSRLINRRNIYRQTDGDIQTNRQRYTDKRTEIYRQTDRDIKTKTYRQTCRRIEEDIHRKRYADGDIQNMYRRHTDGDIPMEIYGQAYRQTDKQTDMHDGDTQTKM